MFLGVRVRWSDFGASTGKSYPQHTLCSKSNKQKSNNPKSLFNCFTCPYVAVEAHHPQLANPKTKLCARFEPHMQLDIEQVHHQSWVNLFNNIVNMCISILSSLWSRCHRLIGLNCQHWLRLSFGWKLLLHGLGSVHKPVKTHCIERTKLCGAVPRSWRNQDLDETPPLASPIYIAHLHSTNKSTQQQTHTCYICVYVFISHFRIYIY